MAIAEMSKLHLVAVSYERDKILNALQTTCAVEICGHTLTENTHSLELDAEELNEYLSSAERALAYLTAGVNDYRRDNKIKPADDDTDAVMTYSEFLAQSGKKDEADAIIARINAFEAEKKNLLSELTSVRRTKSLAYPYSALTEKFAYYTGTAHTEARLGALSVSARDELISNLGEDDLFALDSLCECEGTAIVLALFHKSFEGDRLLQAAGFTSCPFKEGSGSEIYNAADMREAEIFGALEDNARRVYEAEGDIRTLQIYCDYLSFEAEKAALSDKLLATQSTVLMEAYVPKEKEQEVAAAIESATTAAYFEFTEPTEDETPPTLYKNNEVVKNFETITDMYSPPSSREFDPNTVMAFFYSLFLGFIMGDVGYGLMMIIGGGTLYFKSRKKPNALTRLSGVFAAGGFFAIIWGILFNSFFGAELPFFKAVLPAPLGVYWSLMGINIPSVLIVSMFLGIVHLCAGYICLAYQCFRRKQIVDGIFDGLTWALFSIGVGLAVAGLVEDFNCSTLALVGGIIAGVSLVTAMATAGRKEKLLGKFTKGFGAAYGVINYVSDILSYARLYGLMLSGVVIAQIITGFAVTGYNGSTPFLFSGNAGLIVLGVVLLVVGHIFNFAIGLLGAYIHDARLQYVEFYGKFFEGEGELFRPLGSTHKYIRLKK